MNPLLGDPIPGATRITSEGVEIFMSGTWCRVESGTTYALLLRQHGEGCDYTIGCGLAVRPLNATTLEAARIEALGKFMRGDLKLHEKREDGGGHAITEATIIRIEGSVVDEVRAWMAEQAAAQKQQRAATIEAAERAELARFQSKWGPQ